MDISGILKIKGDTTQVSEKFKKRDFVITDDSSAYPQHITFQLAQDKVDLIDKYRIGDVIKVHFNLRGREWTSPKNEIKYFNTLDAWRIEGDGSSNNNQSQQANNNSETFTSSSQEDDLPF